MSDHEKLARALEDEARGYLDAIDKARADSPDGLVDSHWSAHQVGVAHGLQRAATMVRLAPACAAGSERGPSSDE